MAQKRCWLNPFAAWLAGLAGLAVLAGCSTEPPQFQLNREGQTRTFLHEATPEQVQEIKNAMWAMFGDPNNPFVYPETGLDLTKLQRAAGPSWSDEQGRGRGLYRRHCAHCHGVTGDGAGPTAVFLNPYPRDYRWGRFKWKSNFGDSRPTRADLERVIRRGVHGTAMPSFDLLPSAEIEALVEYVMYLGIRGETELRLQNLVVVEVVPLPLSNDLIVEEALMPVVNRWQSADGAVITPADRFVPRITPALRRYLEIEYDLPEDADEAAVREVVEANLENDNLPVEILEILSDLSGVSEGLKRQLAANHGLDEEASEEDALEFVVQKLASGELLYERVRKQVEPGSGGTPLELPEELMITKSIERGARLFQDKRAQCVQCHGPTGLGDGGDKKLYDFWNEGKINPTTNEPDPELAAHYELPPQQLRPRNLRLGIYRGGRRPMDIYRRMYGGIAGTPMPAAGGDPRQPGAKGPLSPDEIWSLVDYVRSLPYEEISRVPHETEGVRRARN